MSHPHDDGLEGKVINISYWMVTDWRNRNHSFLSDVDDLFGDNRYNIVLILMCKTGGRAGLAATDLEGEGYTVMNMAYGFEGTYGWKNAGLPYAFSIPLGGYPD